MKNIFLFPFTTICACILNAQPFSGTYPFTNVTSTSGTSDPTLPPTATSLTFGSFSAAGTPANPNAGGRFSFTNWPAGGTNADDTYANLAGSPSNTEYYEVTLTPTAGYSIDLTGISFSVQRSSTGIRTYSVRSNADGYTTNLPASINPANANLSVQPGNIFFWNFDAMTTNQNGSTITLAAPSFSGLTTPVTFRFYGWNSESSAGTFSIDNVTFTGTANPLFIVAGFISTPVCEGIATSFTDVSQSFNGPIISWAWDFGDGTVSALSNPSHAYDTCGTYNAQLIVTNSNGDDDTIVNAVTVFCNPVAGFSESATGLCVTFTDTSSGGSTYLWGFGDASASTFQNPLHCYPVDTTYIACLIVSNSFGCTDIICDTVTIITTGISETFLNSVSISPNPSTGIFTLDLGTAFSGKAEIVVTNVLGEKIISEEINQRNSQIDLSGQPNEIYFVKIVSEKETIMKTIVVNR